MGILTFPDELTLAANLRSVHVHPDDPDGVLPIVRKLVAKLNEESDKKKFGPDARVNRARKKNFLDHEISEILESHVDLI